MRDFVHLHNHTEYSLLDGLSKCSALANRAAELGMRALAITDHGTMYGVIDFYKACKRAGIKPIIGMEAYVAPASRFDRSRENGRAYHLILLAQDQKGYQNLLKLASKAQLEGFYYKPRIDKELLEIHGEGLIVLSACVKGEIPQLVYRGQEERARQVIRWFQERFPGRFYIELQSHALPEYDATYRELIRLAHELDVPLVATNDSHYTHREQAVAHDVLLCIGTNKTVNDPNRIRMSDDSYYLRTPDEMWALYDDLPEALLNTVKIAEQCNVEIQFAPPYHLPQFPVPEGEGTSQQYLRGLCERGMRWRYGPDYDRPAYVERLNYELGIIHDMGFDDYFLIVWDLCQAARQRDIWWNVRGSGAGSVVAYTLGITTVDPFRNRLMFERFLNPARITMPDIDLDFPDDNRAELIAYTKERYGTDRVAAIITFGTLGARAAIRDVGRALDIPLNEVDRVARMVPNVPGKPVSIAQALESIPELQELYQATPYIKKLLDTAAELEGVTRHASTHAAGILISDRPLVDYLPLHRPTKGDGEDSPVDRVTQWPMEIVEALGMLKIDFLGLRTLKHMRKTCELIVQEHGRKLNLELIPYERVPDDPEKDADVRKLYDLLATGETTGVFQVEGAGMRRTLRDLRPQQFQHIIAVLALYRPGPMENIPTYIRRMHGEEQVTYHHPLLEEILGDTYGIIVYQEQIMQIAVAMAGYKPGEADMIRKAVAKKKRDLMDKHRQMFLEGAVRKGIPQEIARRVWEDIEFFARYGFNRAHATDYAVITAQTAYLKAHYPLEFMTALMTTERHNTEKLGLLIADARRTGLRVERPSINHSEVEFTIEKDPSGERFIRIGLGAIKNVGDEAVRLVVEARKERGPFKSLDDLVDRVDLRKLNRKAVECLIQAGAMDEFGPRPALMSIVNVLLARSAQIHSARAVGQFSLFDAGVDLGETIHLPEFAPPIPDRRLLEWEKELLGTYISRHPLTDQEQELLERDIITTIIGHHTTEAPGTQMVVVGMIQRLRRATTKTNKPMAFVTLEGSVGTLDVVVFPTVYEEVKELLVPGRIVVVGGRLDSRADREDHPLLASWFREPHTFPRPAEDGGEGKAAPRGGGRTPIPGRQARETSSGYAYESSSSDVDEHVAPSAAQPPWESDVSQDLQESDIHLVAEGTSAHRSVSADAASAGAVAHSAPSVGHEAQSETLYITLKRTGDDARDFEKLAKVHAALKVPNGYMPFVIVLEGAGRKSVELAFPNERTRLTPQLRHKIAGLVGERNLRVMRSDGVPGGPTHVGRDSSRSSRQETGASLR